MSAGAMLQVSIPRDGVLGESHRYENRCTKKVIIDPQIFNFQTALPAELPSLVMVTSRLVDLIPFIFITYKRSSQWGKGGSAGEPLSGNT
jgi:hypothetical protein